MSAVEIWRIKGLNNIRPIVVKCPIDSCDYPSITKNGLRGHLFLKHLKAELVELILSTIEGGYVK